MAVRFINEAVSKGFPEPYVDLLRKVTGDLESLEAVAVSYLAFLKAALTTVTEKRGTVYREKRLAYLRLNLAAAALAYSRDTAKSSFKLFTEKFGGTSSVAYEKVILEMWLALNTLVDIVAATPVSVPPGAGLAAASADADVDDELDLPLCFADSRKGAYLELGYVQQLYYLAGAAIRTAVDKWSSEQSLIQEARACVLSVITAADAGEAKKMDIAQYTSTVEVFGGLQYSDRRFFEFVLLPIAKFIYAPRTSKAIVRVDELRAYFQEQDVQLEISDRLSTFFGPRLQTLSGLGVSSDSVSPCMQRRVLLQPRFVGLAVVDQFVRNCLAERNATAKRAVVRDAKLQGASVVPPAPAKPLPPSMRDKTGEKKAKRTKKLVKSESTTASD